MTISPLLDLPDAVAGEGVDAGVAAHYGSLYGEQRTLASGEGFVDLSHRDVLRITGPDRLTWLHSLTTQYFEGLATDTWTEALVLSPQGHVEHAFAGVDDGETFTAHTEPGAGAALIEFLDRMRFMMRVEVTDATAELALTWRPTAASEPAFGGRAASANDPSFGGRAASASERVETPPPQGKYAFVPRADLQTFAHAAGPACGLWAFEALRIERGEPRFGLDTDHRTIPNEVGWIGPAVHLDKGCYRGQETVARVHTLGRPPRRLVMLHLDGSENTLPEVGSDLTLGGKVVGRVGSSARHHELGPVALALVKRNVPTDATLEAAGLVAAQEVVVDPEVGLHVRHKLR